MPAPLKNQNAKKDKVRNAHIRLMLYPEEKNLIFKKIGKGQVSDYIRDLVMGALKNED